jgi:hypothetical protein
MMRLRLAATALSGHIWGEPKLDALLRERRISTKLLKSSKTVFVMRIAK